MGGVTRRARMVRRIGWIAGALSLSMAATTGAQTGDGDGPAGETPAAAEAPREVVVVLTTGDRLRGKLIEEANAHIVLRIANVDTRVARDHIETIIPQRSPRERYLEMRSIIDDADVDRRLLLVDWLRSQDMLDEALEEINAILVLEPENAEAKRIATLVENERSLRRRAGQPHREPAHEPAPQIGRPAPGEFPLLSEDQVNLIKVYEIDLSDPPRLLIERSDVEEFLDAFRDDPRAPSTRDGRAAFHRKPPAEILRTMFELRARPFYGRFKVMTLPDSLRRFRDHVNTTWLVNSCATTQCHGGEDAGRLMLYSRNPGAEEAFLTNLLILERFRFPDGRGLIDFAAPERSRLLDMGLPRQDAATPHPDVQRWTPVFRSRDDRRFRQAVEWIGSMHRPRPEHPIEYAPPTGRETGTDPVEPAQDR